MSHHQRVPMDTIVTFARKRLEKALPMRLLSYNEKEKVAECSARTKALVIRPCQAEINNVRDTGVRDHLRKAKASEIKTLKNLRNEGYMRASSRRTDAEFEHEAKSPPTLPPKDENAKAKNARKRTRTLSHQTSPMRVMAQKRCSLEVDKDNKTVRPTN